MTRQMHLGMMLLASGNHVAGWRMPGAEFGSQNLRLIQHVVSVLERGKFDFVFFADALYTGPDAHPGQIFRLEPVNLLSALAITTSRIGLVATVSTTYTEPYNLARALSTVDHMSNGRAGWNVVTSADERAAANFGLGHLPEHDLRYDMAVEYLQVVKGLWDSWEDGALVGDKEAGVYVDKSKLHVLNHHGTYYNVKGPLNLNRSPQAYPVIFQAGGSDRGIAFAGSTAEVVFAAQQDREEAITFANKLRDAAEAAGRSRDALKIACGVCPIIGRSREDAMDQIARLAGMIDPKAAMRGLSERLGYDMSSYPLDEPVPDLPPTTTGMQGHQRQLFSIARREKLTLRQLRDYAAASMGHRLVIGTPTQIADDLQSWFESGAADGFALMTSHLPAPIEMFVDEVVPILVKRGLFRSEYEGTTLRDHLGLARPPHPMAVA